MCLQARLSLLVCDLKGNLLLATYAWGGHHAQMVRPQASRLKPQLSSVIVQYTLSKDRPSNPHMCRTSLSLTFRHQTLCHSLAKSQLCNQTPTQLWTLPGMLPPALSCNHIENKLNAKLPPPRCLLLSWVGSVCAPYSGGGVGDRQGPTPFSWDFLMKCFYPIIFF